MRMSNMLSSIHFALKLSRDGSKSRVGRDQGVVTEREPISESTIQRNNLIKQSWQHILRRQDMHPTAMHQTMMTDSVGQ
jgi:hypothetical protein